MNLKRILFPLLVLTGLLIPRPSDAQDTAGRQSNSSDFADLVAQLEPVFDETTIAFAHVNLARLDLKLAMERLHSVLTLDIADLVAIEQALVMGAKFQAAIKDTTARELFVVASLFDLDSIPLIAIPTKSPDEAKRLVKRAEPFKFGNLQPFVLGDSKLFVLAAPAVRKRLEDGTLAPRTELADLLKGRRSDMASLHIVPTSDQLRVIRELTPPFPDPIKDVDGEVLADGVRSVAIRLVKIDPLEVRIEISSANRESAEKIRNAIERLKQGMPAKESSAILIKGLLSQLKFDVVDDGLSLVLGEKEEALWLSIRPFLRSAENRYRRQNQANVLKQIMLGMHNYHDTSLTFPDLGPPKSKGRSGLSWRVHLLPFIDQAKLYEQFRLDEPWDSKHNRKLIELIPPIYVPDDASIEKGKTVYVLPRGISYFAKPFPAADEKNPQARVGRRLRDILDGTSNTIGVVPVASKQAVVWTRPVDWEPDKANPLKVFFEPDRKTLTVAFADGSVRNVDLDIDPEQFHAMLTIAAGEVIK